MDQIFIVNIIILILLVIIALVDLKNKVIPSFLTTMAVLLTFIFYYENLIFGIMALLFGLILYEIDWMSGVADLKGIAILGLLAPNMFWGLMTPLFVVIIGNAYIFATKKILKSKEPIAFFPIFPLIQIGLWILYTNFK